MLVVDDLVKHFDSGRSRRSASEDSRVLAVDGVNFDVQDGELFTLLRGLRVSAGDFRPEPVTPAGDGG